MIYHQMRVLEIRTKPRKREIKTANHRAKVMIATALKSKVTAFSYSCRSQTHRKLVKTSSLDAVSEMLFFSNCIFILLKRINPVLSGDSNLVLLSQEN